MTQQPPEKPTKQIAAPSNVEIMLSELQRDVRGLVGGMATLTENYQDISVRMGNAETGLADVSAWRARSSERARGASQTDLTHEAQIATMATDVAEMKGQIAALVPINAKQVELMNEALSIAKKVWSNPKVLLLAGALWTLLVGWLATKGIHLP